MATKVARIDRIIVEIAIRAVLIFHRCMLDPIKISCRTSTIARNTKSNLCQIALEEK